MGVLSVQITSTANVPNVSGQGLGMTQELPVGIFIMTNDTLATVTTAGYLNESHTYFQYPYNNYQMALVYCSDVGCTWLRVTVTYSGANATYSLVVPTEGSGSFSSITLGNGTAAAPSLNFTSDVTTGLYRSASHTIGFAVNGAAAASLSATALTMIGNLVAGNTATAGSVTSFPGTVNGSLVLKAIDAGSAHTTTVSNASSVGQNTTVTIPDPGAATANFILSTSGSAQTIAGGLTVSTGNLAVSQGNVTAGSSGHAGTVTSFPGTAANGSLILAAVNNAGGHNATISNIGSLGQATVYTLADPGAATGTIPVSGTVSTIKMVSKAVVAGGAAAQTVTDAAVVATSVVTAYWNDTTTPCEIETIAPGAGNFVVTSTADPGASHISYVVYN